jgi:GT2 family glycosyltransferase
VGLLAPALDTVTEAPVVVVVAYGDPAGTLSAVRHLGRPRDAVVIVVDNSDSTTLAEAARAESMVYLAGQGNVGFAAGVNLALGQVQPGRDVLLLNPDAQLGWDAVLALQAALHGEGRTAAVAPRLVHPDGSPQQVWWPIPTPLSTWLDAIGVERTRARFLSGAVLLLSGEALAELGGFDERFFLYAEETDWQMRALRAGWSLRLVDETVAVHAGAGTSSDEVRRVQLLVRSALSLQEKWYGTAGARVSWVGSTVAASRRSLLGRRSQREQGRLMLSTLVRIRP